MSRRLSLEVIGGVLVLGAALILIWSVVTTSSARVTASTSGQSFFSAGTISLTQRDVAVEMLFDAEGLYPGLDVAGCVEIEYAGTVPASIRIHADQRGDSGLDEYIDLAMSVASDDSCSSQPPPDGVAEVVYNGRLHSLWRQHPSFDDGIVVLDPARPQEVFTLRAVASVDDDNRAQGLTTEFSITIEARP